MGDRGSRHSIVLPSQYLLYSRTRLSKFCAGSVPSSLLAWARFITFPDLSDLCGVLGYITELQYIRTSPVQLVWVATK